MLVFRLTAIDTHVLYFCNILYSFVVYIRKKWFLFQQSFVCILVVDVTIYNLALSFCSISTSKSHCYEGMSMALASIFPIASGQ